MIRHTNKKKLIHWLPLMNGSGSGGLLELLELLLGLELDDDDEDDDDGLEGSRDEDDEEDTLVGSLLLLLLDMVVEGVRCGGLKVKGEVELTAKSERTASTQMSNGIGVKNVVLTVYLQ